MVELQDRYRKQANIESGRREKEAREFKSQGRKEISGDKPRERETVRERKGIRKREK